MMILVCLLNLVIWAMIILFVLWIVTLVGGPIAWSLRKRLPVEGTLLAA